MVAEPNCVQLAVVSAGKAAADPKDNGVVLYYASVAVVKVLEHTEEMSVMITSYELLLRKLKVTFPFPLLFTTLEQTGWAVTCVAATNTNAIHTSHEMAVRILEVIVFMVLF